MLRGSKVRSLILLCLALMLAPLAKDQNNERRDGNWWRSQPELGRYKYMTGFMDGLYLGYEFSYWKTLNTDKKECAASARDSFEEHSNTYMQNVTNVQLADGLTSFYEDYRNRRIILSDATWLVLNEIKGTPKSLESWRKNAQ